MTNLSIFLGKTKLASCIANASGPKCDNFGGTSA